MYKTVKDSVIEMGDGMLKGIGPKCEIECVIAGATYW